MEFKDVVLQRRSIRQFKEEPVDFNLIEQAISLAKFYPSWKHTSIARFTYVSNADVLKKIADEGSSFPLNMNTLAHSPAVIVVSYVTKRSGYERDGTFSSPKGDQWEMFDAGIATHNLSLALHSVGLGSVILGLFNEERIAELINLPENEKIATVLCVGYPAAIPEAPKRKENSEILRRI